MKYSNLMLLLIIPIINTSCKKFLDAKPDKQLVVPSTIEDLKGLLLADVFMNDQYPNAGAISTDNFFLFESDVNAMGVYARDAYVWSRNLQVTSDNWSMTYKRIMYCNVVLDNLPSVKGSAADKAVLEGMARFFRGYSLFQGTDIFTKPFDANANTNLGMPLKYSADINTKTERATLQQTYDAIITDLSVAANLLPTSSEIKTLPGKAAAYAVLADVLLTMGDYQNSKNYADSCLRIQHDLIDFTKLDTTDEIPIQTFNTEVIFHARLLGSELLYPSVCKIDSALYGSYQETDLRKRIFFQRKEDGYAYIKSCMDGPYYGILYSGISVDELYLIRAETNARLGDIQSCIADIRTLCSNRYINYQPPSTNTAKDALSLVLSERRKELVLRGNCRWKDLRRLNKEGAFETTLHRYVGRITSLAPNDSRYTMYIPANVIELSGIEQNQR